MPSRMIYGIWVPTGPSTGEYYDYLTEDLDLVTTKDSAVACSFPSPMEAFTCVRKLNKTLGRPSWGTTALTVVTLPMYDNLNETGQDWPTDSSKE